jgi:hypothetical protein
MVMLLAKHSYMSSCSWAMTEQSVSLQQAQRNGKPHTVPERQGRSTAHCACRCKRRQSAHRLIRNKDIDNSRLLGFLEGR